MGSPLSSFSSDRNFAELSDHLCFFVFLFLFSSKMYVIKYNKNVHKKEKEKAIL